VLAALAATLRLYRAGVAQAEIPIWRQIAAPTGALEARARALAAQVARAGTATGASVRAAPTESTIGGGSLPGQTLPSWSVTVDTPSPQRLLTALRAGAPPVIGRVVDDAVVLDLRTVEAQEDAELAAALGTALRDQSGTEH
jgi:L-seryl-tRNA(Ser) seleniumtransferase